MIADVTSPYLEKIRQRKASAEITAGTIVISDTERLVPVRGGYLHIIHPPKDTLEKLTIPIIYKHLK